MFFTVVIALCAILTYYIYLSEKRKKYYWKAKGVQSVPYKPFLGLIFDYALASKGSLGCVYKDVYFEYPNQKYVGAFSGSSPNLVLRDPKLFQYVLQKEHTVFNSRGATFNPKIDKLTDNVLFMEGPRWKLMRQKLTPVFTSGKLRNMFNIINDSGKEFKNFVEEMSKEDKNHSLMNIISTFTQSSIGASVFGLNANPGKDFDSPLHIMARDFNTPSRKNNFNFIFASMFPELIKILKIQIFGAHEKFFITLIKSALKLRKDTGVKRNDFIDNCLEIQKEKIIRDPSTGYELQTTDELMAAQAFFFFTAGVEPSATGMNFTLYELSKHQDILKAVHKEIDEVFSEHEDLTYEIVEKMELLEKVICESMRMYPSIPHIQRKSVENHVLPDGLKIDKNVIITVPTLAVHRDPKFYPNPLVFDPERFTPDAIKERPQYTYLPFGEGNRICIGMRYAKLQIKTGLIHLLHKFTVRATEDSFAEPTYDKSFFSLRCDTLKYKFVKRN